jgi:arginine repressor
MTEPRLGSCHTCGTKVTRSRLVAMLRRLELRHLIARDPSLTQAELASALRSRGFAATKRLTVTKDLKAIGAQRTVDARWTLADNPKE